MQGNRSSIIYQTDQKSAPPSRLVTSQRMRTGWRVLDSPTGGSEFEMGGYSLSKIKSKECSKEAPVMDTYLVGTNKNRRVASLHCAMLFFSIVTP